MMFVHYFIRWAHQRLREDVHSQPLNGIRLDLQGALAATDSQDRSYGGQGAPGKAHRYPSFAQPLSVKALYKSHWLDSTGKEEPKGIYLYWTGWVLCIRIYQCSLRIEMIKCSSQLTIALNRVSLVLSWLARVGINGVRGRCRWNLILARPPAVGSLACNSRSCRIES